jgi:hypothetical protein
LFEERLRSDKYAFRPFFHAKQGYAQTRQATGGKRFLGQADIQLETLKLFKMMSLQAFASLRVGITTPLAHIGHGTRGNEANAVGDFIGKPIFKTIGFGSGARDDMNADNRYSAAIDAKPQPD